MSIALERSSNNNRIESTGFIRGRLSCKSNFESTTETGTGRSSSMSGILPEDRRLPLNNPVNMGVVDESKDLDDSCSSSSIGRNSDSSERLSVESDAEDDTEVQSSYKGPLDTMDALEEVLPIRRGISKFYCGKSKSFTSLADASASSSIKDLAKPDDAYTRKRKNLLACSNIISGNNKNRSMDSLRRSDVGFGGGISSSKRLTNSNRRSTFPLAMGTSSSESNNTSENSNSSSSSPPRLRPPLHPPAKSSLNNTSSSPPTPPPPQRKSAFSPWRSFSLTDLQGAADDASDSNREGSSSTTQWKRS